MKLDCINIKLSYQKINRKHQSRKIHLDIAMTEIDRRLQQPYSHFWILLDTYLRRTSEKGIKSKHLMPGMFNSQVTHNLDFKVQGYK